MLDSIINNIYHYGVIDTFTHLIFVSILSLTLFYILYKKKMFNIYERTFLYILIILVTLHHIMKQQY